MDSIMAQINSTLSGDATPRDEELPTVTADQVRNEAENPTIPAQPEPVATGYPEYSDIPEDATPAKKTRKKKEASTDDGAPFDGPYNVEAMIGVFTQKLEDALTKVSAPSVDTAVILSALTEHMSTVDNTVRTIFGEYPECLALVRDEVLKVGEAVAAQTQKSVVREEELTKALLLFATELRALKDAAKPPKNGSSNGATVAPTPAPAPSPSPEEMLSEAKMIRYLMLKLPDTEEPIDDYLDRVIHDKIPFSVQDAEKVLRRFGVVSSEDLVGRCVKGAHTF
jgi:hypothetical protein